MIRPPSVSPRFLPMTPTIRLAPPAVEAPAPEASARPWVRWGVVLGVWGLIILLDTAQLTFHFEQWEPANGWTDALERNLPPWGLWALFTPVIFHLSRRFPLERGRLRRTLPVHLAAALGLIGVHHVLYVGTAFAIGWPAQYDHTPATFLLKQATGKTTLYLLIYFAVAGAFHALDYHRRLRERELAASRLQASLAEAHLHALKTQIQPHFLFNTLNAVSVLVLKGETQCAIRMLSRLSDLLRLTLENSGAQEVTLREELELLGRYLDIERVRFADRLTVEIDAAPEAMEARVPSLILQPLVENAVRHGVAQTLGAGRVEVRATKDGERLRLEVRDTGPGLPAGGEVTDGIGLSNTRGRLAHLYGADARFTIGDAPGGGALAVVELPFRTSPSTADASSAAPSSGASAAPALSPAPRPALQ
jgi:two-component system, LytTR family, sensor kinase